MIDFLLLLRQTSSWSGAYWPFRERLLTDRVTLPSLDAVVAELEAVSDDDFAYQRDEFGLIATEVPIATSSYFIHGTGTTAQFVAFAKEHPQAAITRWGYANNLEVAKKLTEPGVLAAVAEIIRKNPHFGKYIPPLLWHHLLEEGEDVRATLVTNCPQEDFNILWVTMETAQTSELLFGSFSLRLPAERSALLSLGSALVVIPARGEFVKEFVADLVPLAEIADDGDLPTSERLGAVLVGMLHPHGSLEFAVEHSELLVASGKQWPNFISLLMQGIGQLDGWDTPAIRRLLNSLIAASPIEASSRAGWQNFYRKCREHSRAPVTESGSLEGWLEYGAE